MNINLLRSTYHPVVKTYMDIIQKGCYKANIQCLDVLPSDKHINKKELLLTDSPLVAIKYILKGFDNHIVWFQGVAPEESFISNKSRIRSKVISWIEKIVLKKAKMVFLVSEAMKNHYEKKYKVDLSRKSFVMPCFNETHIVDSAFQDEKYTKNTFLYVGGLHAWQCFEQTVELYSHIEKQANTKTEFLVYTFQKELAEEIIKKYGLKNYLIDCVDKEELSERIKGAKYGFVLREDCVVNNVATPTKFSNYLANGIIPIYSSALKSFANFDKENKLGIVYNLDNISSGIEGILSHMQRNIAAKEVRLKCEKAFDEYYNADAYATKISQKLKELIK